MGNTAPVTCRKFRELRKKSRAWWRIFVVLFASVSGAAESASALQWLGSAEDDTAWSRRKDRVAAQDRTIDVGDQQNPV